MREGLEAIEILGEALEGNARWDEYLLGAVQGLALATDILQDIADGLDVREVVEAASERVLAERGRVQANRTSNN